MDQAKLVKFFVSVALMHVKILRVQKKFQFLHNIRTLLTKSFDNPYFCPRNFTHPNAVKKEVQAFDCHFLVIRDVLV